ncbi:MAG: hypothetical protein KGL72_02445 [Actinomycetales bacterium]|nr:hypothetical protein [Actinomycetales bacterium]
MTTNDWQSRLMSDDELQHVLANLGALEGMQVLQRQLELRSQSHEASSDLREEVSSHPELGLTDVVQIIDAPMSPEPEVKAEPQVQETAPATDIAGSLNALFANRQQVSFEPVAPLEVSETPRVVPEAVANPGYNPVPLESNTNSFFIPTFSNPLPGTESIEVVTPMAQPIDPAKVSSSKSDEEPVATAETPVAAPLVQTPPVAEWESSQEPALEIPSAEEAITAFEEADTTSTAQPNLVDDVILSVGGELDESLEIPLVEPAASVAATVTAEAIGSELGQTSPQPKRLKSGLGKLIATWNGTGNLLFLIAAGFATASMHFSLATVLVGAFGALAVTGFGFGTAALSAKRGAQPQATLSRAAFGVRAAAIPLVFVTIAGYAATSLASTFIVTGVHFFYPALPGLVFGLPVQYLLLGALLLLAAAATVFDGARRLLMTRTVAYVSFAWIAAVLGFGISSTPKVLDLGAVNSQQALALASVLLIVISIIWGTSAADETPQLATDLHPAKLLATGLLSHSIIGTIAVWAGFAFANVVWAPLVMQILGGLFALAAIAALSHQIRRIADSYSGFGLMGTRWWVVVGSLIIVAAGTVSMWLFVDPADLAPGVESLLPVAGVPVIAWLATYGVDTVLRRDEYHEVSLLRDYGFYGRVRVINLAGWIIATAVGLGFVESWVPGFAWLGYIAHPLGYSATGLQADTGVWIAFAIGVIAPLFTVGAIREQEAEGQALANRHKDLINVLGDL